MDWQTPDIILDLCKQFSGEALGRRTISLDPCADPNRVFADVSYGEDANGLVADWKRMSADGLVYVNPPYGREIPKWVQKAMFEAEKGAEIILLVPSRTDTRWFQDAALSQVDAICFWRGRLTFEGAPDPAPFPSALLYCGRHPNVFGQVFHKYGYVVRT